MWFFESFFGFFLQVRPRTYGHARAKEQPVWLLFLARGLKVFLVFFARTATHVQARTYGHARRYVIHQILQNLLIAKSVMGVRAHYKSKLQNL